MKVDKTMILIETEALNELAKKLEGEDFSQTSHKEEIRKKVLKYIKEKEVSSMKKTRIFKKPAVAVASILIGATLFSQTAIAKEVAYKIKEIFSIADGNINIIQEEPMESVAPVPENLKGQIFDAEGNEVEWFSDELSSIYTKSGEQIMGITNDENNEYVIVTKADYEAEQAETTLVLKDVEERNAYTCFDVKLPEYLPEDYQFDHIELYKDNEGKVENSKYIDIHYVNEVTGDSIYMQQRYADEETAYTTGTDGKVEQVQVNGAEAIIMDDRDIHWEANGVLYQIIGRDTLGKDELLKIAESIK